MISRMKYVSRKEETCHVGKEKTYFSNFSFCHVKSPYLRIKYYF